MYDLNKRSYFTNLGELRMLLANLPNETEVCTGGVLGSYLHFEKDRDLVSFDDEELDDCYDEDLDYSEEYPEYYDENEGYLDYEITEYHQLIEGKEYDQRQKCIDEGWQAFFVGDKLMRTFLVIDDSIDEEDGECYGACWDFELYDVKLTPIESGQLGKQGNMTREEVIDKVLSWNHLEKEDRNYLHVTENLVELCESSK